MSKKWGETMGFYRLLGNDKVDEASIIAHLIKECVANCTNRNVITIMDTTEINCLEKNNRLKCYEGLGVLSDNKTKGFLSHPAYCLDAHTLEPLGIGGVRLIGRLPGGSLSPKRKRTIVEKESDKWFTPALQIREEVLSEVVHNTFVYDREGDIFEVFSEVPNVNTDMVVRSKTNRRVKTQRGKISTLNESIKKIKSSEEIEFTKHTKSGSRIKIKARLKFTNLKILKPEALSRSISDKSEVPVGIIEVRQIGKIEPGHQEVIWRIITSIEIKDVAKALEILNIYRSRWKIEEFFRLIKKEGFNIESSELEKGRSIRKLSLLIMEAALIIEKLKMSRDGEGDIKTSELFDEQEIELLQILSDNLEGKTQKQKNPYPKNHLSWASWVIARLGGWKGFNSQRPPGAITYFRGLQDFATAFMTYNLVKKKNVYKP